MASPARTRRPVAGREATVGAAPRVRLFVPSRGWGGRHRRRILVAAGVIAVLLHVLATVAVLEAPHLLPNFLAPAPPPPPPRAQTDPPTIDMVEDQNRYAGGSKPTPPANPSPPAPPAPPGPAQPQAAPDRSEQPPTAPSHDTDAVPPAAPPRAEVQAPPPAPPKQASSSQPEVDLDPADGLGYGHQDDPQVIPASPDDHRANKMPPYPRAAGRRGEEGSVEMLVSVGTDGAVSAVEVAVSSGHPDLDRTAKEAVSRWHFHPARQNGVAVPMQMMQVFNFKIDR